jgi:hypothetical protein
MKHTIEVIFLRTVVRRFDDRWISGAHSDMSYELDLQDGNLTYASSTMKDGIATTIIGAGIVPLVLCWGTPCDSA